MKAILVHKKFFPQLWLIGEWGYQEEKAILEDCNRSRIEYSHREQEAIENAGSLIYKSMMLDCEFNETPKFPFCMMRYSIHQCNSSCRAYRPDYGYSSRKLKKFWKKIHMLRRHK